MPNYYPEDAGATSHVRDCRMWAEIDYLDSPTDYREYLPGQKITLHAADPTDLVMLDSQSQSSTRNATRFSLVVMGIITTLIFLLISGCFLRLFLDVF